METTQPTEQPEAEAHHYYCKRHGIVNASAPVRIAGSSYPRDGLYCGECFADLVISHCDRVGE